MVADKRFGVGYSLIFVDAKRANSKRTEPSASVAEVASKARSESFAVVVAVSSPTSAPR